jgi:hypothetical protein
MQRLLFEKHYHGDGLEESNRLSLFAMALLVFAVVTGVGYATYLFIDASGISDVAGVHITNSFSLAADDLRGKLYTDESRGIKDWMIHTDKVNGFELKHPNDWEMQATQKDGIFLFLRTYKKSDTKSSSLLMTVEVRGSDEKSEGKSLRDIIMEEGFIWQDNWKKEEMGGYSSTRTGKIKTADGLLKDAIFWTPAVGDKGFYLEATYYTDNYNDAKYNEDVFNKVISEFKFL